ncbi:tetraspanin-8-like [Dorcoceras hygrometricum]|uniref:Tetraspanin-8-like n=1 Tax=Dorcoceras hygrometricum TaxID=472368 RepID=A0A2Z7BVZ5_9LAMI|nr:tetraspanin-8-like [Dorcoceras hygrometricum]
MANQIKRRNVSSLTYKNFPGGHPSQYCSHPCTLNSTSIYDAKYHISLSTRCVLGKWVYLVTHAMSLFDLQDVCMVVGSLATLDLSMVVDLIGIFELKGPYCTLTMTDWFLQALSLIHRGSWDDVVRRFTMIRWETLSRVRKKNTKIYSANSSPLPSSLAVAAYRRRRRPPSPSEFVPTISARRSVREIFVGFLVQTGEGVEILVVDRIRRRSIRSTVEVPIPSWNWSEPGA